MTLNKSTKTISLFACLFLITFFFNSCAKKIAFEKSTVVPAARGIVKVKNDKNNNYAINVHLTYLAEPNRLEPPKHTYVVWVLTEDNVSHNIGQIKTSNSLSVSFETVTAYKPIRILITAEDDSNVQYPSMTLVLTTNNF
jgi:hypothetical protein